MAKDDPYHVYLNDVGYLLATDGKGRLASGAVSERVSDPFMHHTTGSERWKVAEFRFDGGAGAAEHDASHRYMLGYGVDTRSGRVMRALKANACQLENDEQVIVDVNRIDTLSAQEISNAAGAVDGLGVRFLAPKTASVREVAFLVKANVEKDWNGAASVTFAIRQDAAGPAPGALVRGETRAVYLYEVEARVGYGCYPWKAGEFFWLVINFNPAAALTLGSYYWLTIENSQAYEVYWARTENPQATVSEWTGAAWGNGATEDSPIFQLRFGDELDSFPVCFEEFRGSDGYARLYAGVGDRVMYWDLAGGWAVSKQGTAMVLDLCVFNAQLFTAYGTGVDLERSTGATAVGVWAAVANERAVCFGVHDGMIWKAGGDNVASGGHLVAGSLTGATATYGADLAVGDPGTEVGALVSHGGQLYAVKPEGVFEITYPSTYPGSGVLTCNLVLPFATEKALRRWALDWHSGFYFPGVSAVLEWKSGILRDLWSKIDPETETREVAQSEQVWSRPERWQQMVNPGMGGWTCAVGTTRGLFVAMSHCHVIVDDPSVEKQASSIWFYDGHGWHPIFRDFPNFGEPVMALYFQDWGHGAGRLWFGCGLNVYYIDLPSWTLDLSQVEGLEWEDTKGPSYLLLPVFDGDEPDVKKDWGKVAVKTKNAGDGSGDGGGVCVKYILDDELQTWWDGGFLGWVTANPYTELEFEAGTTGRRVHLALGFQLDADDTPEVEYVKLFYQPLPDEVETFAIQVRIGDGMETRSKVRDDRTAVDYWTALKALKDLAEPWTYTDELGENHTVRLLALQRGSMKEDDAGRLEGRVLVSMIAIPTAGESYTIGPELVENGTFDTDVDGWSLSGSWKSDDGYPDNGCLDISTGMVPPTLSTQAVYVPEPGEHRLQFYAKVANVAHPLNVILAESGGVRQYWNEDITLSLANTWELQTIDVVLPAGLIDVTFQNANTSSSMYVDTVSLKSQVSDVPAP